METSIESCLLRPGEDACGIYFLVRAGRVIYIGQSVSIARRVATHRKTVTFDEVRYVKVAKPSLDKAERKFILLNKPELNGLTRNGMRDYCEPKDPTKRKFMTSKQFRELLHDACMSQRQMAKAIGLNERTIRRYVTPGATIPRVVELAARWAAQEALRKLSEM